jgi:hypothetical protein
MLATKNRHEFRIRLQKRARLRLEKKLETVRDDLDWQTVSNRVLLTAVASVRQIAVVAR